MLVRNGNNDITALGIFYTGAAVVYLLFEHLSAEYGRFCIVPLIYRGCIPYVPLKGSLKRFIFGG